MKSVLASLGYFLMVLWFCIGLVNMASDKPLWLVAINFGTACIWGVTATLWMVAAANER
ncbi:hypothetical protein SEA_BILLNYE_206 [Streptomyces phage BillNye]|uniref:Uncharacterized protein n=1 Tax=Streptomyces phage BillNye TaxID=2079426 RepID=A0A2L1IW31_9CAUD|nr:hypothetical protein FDJ30_gp055 [Streptomyces phage BillNye]AVD99378.1 hypothetical protein SEA_BILLNYE_206 [Streptomyces phage BillNye]